MLSGKARSSSKLNGDGGEADGTLRTDVSTSADVYFQLHFGTWHQVTVLTIRTDIKMKCMMKTLHTGSDFERISAEAFWSTGMILASGATGFNSRNLSLRAKQCHACLRMQTRQT